MPVTIESARRDIRRELARAVRRVKKEARPRVTLVKRARRISDRWVNTGDLVYYEGKTPVMRYEVKHDPVHGPLYAATFSTLWSTRGSRFLTYGFDPNTLQKPTPYGMGTLLLDRDIPDRLKSVYNRTLLTDVMREEVQPLLRLHKSMRRQFMRASMSLSGRKEAYVTATRILGRRPSMEELAIARAMRHALEPLLDTPMIALPTLKRLSKRLWRHRSNDLRVKTIAAAGRMTSERITREGQKKLDSMKRLRPRHWRWLVRQNARVMRRLGAEDPPEHTFVRQVMLACDYFPDTRRHGNVIRELARWPVDYDKVIVQVALEAIKKYVTSPKWNARDAWSSPRVMSRILVRLDEASDSIKVDGDLRRASLERLYHMATKLGELEPEEALQYGRFRMSMPTGDEPVKVGMHSFIPLLTHLDLYNEGQLMNHCLFGGWARHHASGDYRSYRVLCGERHAATLMLHANYGNGWRLSQLVGKHNTNLTYEQTQLLNDAYAFMALANERGTHEGSHQTNS